MRADGPDGMPRGGATFREEQRFRQPWLWVLVVMMALFSWAFFVSELFGSLSPTRGSGELWVTILVWLLVGVGLPALFAFCRLVVEVRSDGLYFRYHPFHRSMHRISWEEIRSAEARTYNPIREYGGWGIRAGWRKESGKAYNVYGNRGVQLELSGGRRVLFGSQRADELASALVRAMAD